MPPTLLVIGCSPAWERGLYFRDFQPGEVNRAADHWEYASGKATNLCRALIQYRNAGNPCATPLLLTTLGGKYGERFRAALHQEFGEALELQEVASDSETRVCTNLLSHQKEMTELVEEAAPIAPSEAADLLERINVLSFQGCALAGNIPAGSPKTLPQRIAEAAASNPACTHLYLDNWKNFREMGAAFGFERCVLKINRSELLKLMDAPEETTLLEAIDAFAREFPKTLLGVTDGLRAAYLKVPGEDAIAFPVSKAEPLVNALGAGDTASGVFFGRMMAGTAPAQAFAEGLQAATTSCSSRIAADLNAKP